MIRIEQLKEASAEAVNDISRLLSQLRENPEEHVATLNELKAVVEDKNVVFIVAKDGDHIIGMATLYMLTKFSKRIAYVEDVVVDGAYRGQGLGEKIMRALIDIARAEGVKTLNLTSRPARVAANKLYQKLGFEQKETNPYRLRL